MEKARGLFLLPQATGALRLERWSSAALMLTESERAIKGLRSAQEEKRRKAGPMLKESFMEAQLAAIAAGGPSAGAASPSPFHGEPVKAGATTVVGGVRRIAPVPAGAVATPAVKRISPMPADGAAGADGVSSGAKREAEVRKDSGGGLLMLTASWRDRAM